MKQEFYSFRDCNTDLTMQQLYKRQTKMKYGSHSLAAVDPYLAVVAVYDLLAYVQAHATAFTISAIINPE